MTENTYTHAIEHTLRDIIAEQDGDPEAERVTNVEYAGGELTVETAQLTADDRERAAAKAIVSRDDGEFAEVIESGYRAAVFKEDQQVVVEGESVEGDETFTYECSEETAGVIAAATEVDPRDE